MTRDFSDRCVEKIEDNLFQFHERFELIREHIPENSKCFDYGCNVGYNAFRALETNGVDITGVDHDFSSLAIAQQLLKYNKLPEERIRFVHTRADSYLSNMDDGYYDCLLCFLIGHHLLRDIAKEFPANKPEIDSLDDKRKASLQSFDELMTLIRDKSKKSLVQLRLGTILDKYSDYSDYQDDNFKDYLLNSIGFKVVTPILSTPQSYAAPHPIYLCES